MFFELNALHVFNFFNNTPYTSSKRKTILPVHLSSIRTSPRLMEKNVSLNSINKSIYFYKFKETPYIENLYTHYVLKFKASRLDTLNRRNAIQTLVPIQLQKKQDTTSIL